MAPLSRFERLTNGAVIMHLDHYAGTRRPPTRPVITDALLFGAAAYAYVGAHIGAEPGGDVRFLTTSGTVTALPGGEAGFATALDRTRRGELNATLADPGQVRVIEVPLGALESTHTRLLPSHFSAEPTFLLGGTGAGTGQAPGLPVICAVYLPGSLDGRPPFARVGSEVFRPLRQQAQPDGRRRWLHLPLLADGALVVLPVRAAPLA
jgi:hypothetical protein